MQYTADCNLKLSYSFNLIHVSGTTDKMMNKETFVKKNLNDIHFLSRT